MNSEAEASTTGVKAALTRRSLLERAAALGGTVFAADLLAACGGSSSSSVSSGGSAGTPKRGGKLRTGHVGGGNTESLNPLISANYIDNARAQQLYDMLFVPRSDLTNAPSLADSIVADQSATVWQLKLRTGVMFHNGKPFGADDVLYTWQWVLDPKNKATGQSTLAPLDMKNTRKISDSEIEVHLNYPVGDLKSVLSSSNAYIIPNGFTDFLHPIGTGPFKFVNWTQGVQSYFVRNPNYWGSGPYVDNVTMHSIPDATARLNALLGGQVDAMETMTYPQAKAQTGNSAVKILQTTSPATVPFTMRIDTAPFTDNHIRQAVKYAVNRQQMLEVALQGYGSIGNDLFGKGFPSYNSDLAPLAYDPEKAKSLLKTAGSYPLSLTLYTSNGVVAGAYEAATAYVEQAKPAGINVTLQEIPPDQYFNTADKYMSASAPFYQSSWPYSFEEQATQALVKNAPYNGETQWWKVNPQWGQELIKAQGIADDTARNARYKELQVPLYNEGGYCVWGYTDLVDAYIPKLNGVTGNPLFPLGYYEFKDWWFTS